MQLKYLKRINGQICLRGTNIPFKLIRRSIENIFTASNNEQYVNQELNNIIKALGYQKYEFVLSLQEYIKLYKPHNWKVKIVTHGFFSTKYLAAIFLINNKPKYYVIDRRIPIPLGSI